MDERRRNEIVRLHYARTSQRKISVIAGVSRHTVKKIIEEHEAQRDSGAPHPDLRPAVRRGSRLLSDFEERMKELLGRYPDLTAVRMREELQAEGFKGGYTIVKNWLRRMRGRQDVEPVERFETLPGEQAQIDYSSYKIKFTGEGALRIHIFSHILAWSRKQYIQLADDESYETTVCELIRAFESNGGVTSVIVVDNMKVAVDRWEDDEPIYNARFLAFCTHYGARPWACRPRRSKTKGKVERPFDYFEKNFLNGRTFHNCADLRDRLAKWLSDTANVREHRETKARPEDRFEEERRHLLGLPATRYHTSKCVYRVVDDEGYVSHASNQYSVPWRRIGELLPVLITESEVIVYSRNVLELARHERFPTETKGQKRTVGSHRPDRDPEKKRSELRVRFRILGEEAESFLECLLREHRYGTRQAQKILGLLGLYRRGDVAKALERALRYRAVRFSAVERILGAMATPRPASEAYAHEAAQRLPSHLREDPLSPRGIEAYRELFCAEGGSHESNSEKGGDERAGSGA